MHLLPNKYPFLDRSTFQSYTDPANPPDYDDTDPRWIGAWWIGFLVIGIPLVLFGPLFCLFPERLPIKNT